MISCNEWSTHVSLSPRFLACRYVGSGDNYVYSLSPTTGAVNWRFKTGGALGSTAVSLGGVVYFASQDGYLYVHVHLQRYSVAMINFLRGCATLCCYDYTPAVASLYWYVLTSMLP